MTLGDSGGDGKDDEAQIERISSILDAYIAEGFPSGGDDGQTLDEMAFKDEVWVETLYTGQKCGVQIDEDAMDGLICTRAAERSIGRFLAHREQALAGAGRL